MAGGQFHSHSPSGLGYSCDQHAEIGGPAASYVLWLRRTTLWTVDIFHRVNVKVGDLAKAMHVLLHARVP